MKSLLAGMFVAMVLLPASQVKQEETARGTQELIDVTVTKVKESADKNNGHVWVKTSKYNLSQRYAHWKELRAKGYDVDAPIIGSTFIGW